MNDRELIAVLAHEVRNALGPIKLGAQQLQRDACDAESRTHTALRISRQVRQIERVISNVLARSQTFHGQLVLHRARCNVSGAVRDAVDAYREVALQKGITLTSSIVGGIIGAADETRLQQVLGNLLHNSCKYTPAGGTIHVELRRDDSIGAVALTVSDTGIGIEPERLDRIFDPYVRDHAERPSDSGSLGLGLAMVKQLVELHHGRVQAQSSGLGKGTTFCVLLPIEEAMPASEEDATGCWNPPV